MGSPAPAVLPFLKLPRRWLWRLLLTGLCLLIAVAALNFWMLRSTRDRIFQNTGSVPVTPVALVLGTAKMIGGGVNVHFTVRMEAAELLYKSGRIKHFLVSGDNSRDGYNEPEDMKADLMARGIPAAAITCDYAGFRTLDSVVRAKENFGLTRCVIISDDFHLARALWLADRQGLAATGFYAPPVIWKNSWRPRCREWLARIGAVVDGVTGKRPKFGGEKITLSVAGD